MNTSTKNIILTPLNLLYKISPKTELKLLFCLKQGYKLNLKNPKTFNEKLQWIKLYDKNPLMPKCVDKYTVREYAKEKGCGEILNELIWQGFNPEDIPFDKLPKKFVIKVTHGSTFNIICTDKTKLDKEQAKKQLKKWLKAKFLPCYGEWFYGVEKPRIIIEKFIESKVGLKDYKVFCFNGEPKYIGVYSDRSNGNKPHQELYDTKWNLINEHTDKFEQPSKLTSKPKNLKALLDYARKLSKDFRHVRVDFFIEKDEIYFGELTFTSGAGYGKFSSKKFAEEMGDQLSLKSSKPKVLMVGPARNIKGGMTTVIDNYYACGLNKQVDLKYIESINDKCKISKFLKEIKGLLEFRKNIKDYDIVHIHMASRRSTFRKIKYIKIAKKANKKVIVHVHGGGFETFFKNETSESQKKYIVKNLNKTDLIIVLSSQWNSYFSSILSAKIMTLENPIILPKDYRKKQNNNILFLGRIEKNKGIFELLVTISEIKDVINNLHLYIAGVGNEKRVGEQIKKLGIEKYVTRLGWIDGKTRDYYLKKCSFIAIPSYYEALSMSLLEAMVNKCIPIASDVGGIPSIVKNGKNGFLFNPHNQLQMNSVFKSCLLLEDGERKKIQQQAREDVAGRFDEKIILGKLVNAYYEQTKLVRVQ